jgi:hypothetical protein
MPGSASRTALRVLAVIALLLIAWDVGFRLRHPAPLGRSAAAWQKRLTRDLPLGTPLDTVSRYLSLRGLNGTRTDSTIRVAQYDIIPPWPFTGAVRATIYFDSSRRLRRIETDSWLDAL